MENRITFTGIGLLVFGLFSNIVAEILPMIFGELPLLWVRVIFAVSLVGMAVGLFLVWWGNKRTRHKLAEYRIQIEEEREKRAKRREVLQRREPYLYQAVDIARDIKNYYFNKINMPEEFSVREDEMNGLFTDFLLASNLDIHKIKSYKDLALSEKTQWKLLKHVLKMLSFLRNVYSLDAERYFIRVGEILDSSSYGLSDMSKNDQEYKDLMSKYKSLQKYMSKELLRLFNRYFNYSYGIGSFLIIKAFNEHFGRHKLTAPFLDRAYNLADKKLPQVMEYLSSELLDSVDDYLVERI